MGRTLTIIFAILTLALIAAGSVHKNSSAPASAARPIHSAILAVLPSMSPTVGSIWARAMRKPGSAWSRQKYRRQAP